MKHNRPTIYEKSKDIVLVSTTLTHNAEVTIDNPFRTSPSAIFVDGSAFPVSWRMINSKTIGVTAQLPPPFGATLLRRTTDQPAITSVVTPVQFATEDLPDGGVGFSHSTSTNPSRITCLTAGLVHVCGTAVFQASATGARECFVTKNGTNSGTNTRWAYVSLPTAAALVAANDYLELQMYQDSGGTLQILGSGGFGETRLELSYVKHTLAGTTATATLLVLP